MEEKKSEKLKISNDLLDAMLVGVKTQEDLWGKEGIITQLNKALLERILNAEMDFHLLDTDVGRGAGNTRNGYGRKTLKSNFGTLEIATPRDRTDRISRSDKGHISEVRNPALHSAYAAQQPEICIMEGSQSSSPRPERGISGRNAGRSRSGTSEVRREMER